MARKFHSDVILKGESYTEVDLVKLFAVWAFVLVASRTEQVNQSE